MTYPTTDEILLQFCTRHKRTGAIMQDQQQDDTHSLILAVDARDLAAAVHERRDMLVRTQDGAAPHPTRAIEVDDLTAAGEHLQAAAALLERVAKGNGHRLDIGPNWNPEPDAAGVLWVGE